MNAASGEDYFLLVRAETGSVAKIAFVKASKIVRDLRNCCVLSIHLQRSGYAQLPHIEANYDPKFDAVFVRPILA